MSHTNRQTQTHRAYKWLQVPLFNLTVNVGNDNIYIRICIQCSTYNATSLLENIIMNSKPEYRSALSNLIECRYNLTIRVLHSAALSNIPVIPRTSLKPWCTSELTDCKNKAIASHRIWVNSGRPMVGAVFLPKKGQIKI